MKTAIKEAQEIRRLILAAENTKSRYLRSDYGKAVKRKKKELQEYCGFRGIDYKAVCLREGI